MRQIMSYSALNQSGRRKQFMSGGCGLLVRRTLAGLLAALTLAAPCAIAQNLGGHNEIEVKRLPNIQDKEGIWVLDFKFKSPRLITVDIPGRGRRVCWYLLYSVINNTKEPRTFIPDFELVTLDKPHVYHDQVLPKVQEAIQRIEDPTGHLDFKNSVTIASEPIPPSKPNALPRAVNGVAIWDDVSPEATRYSIYVSGLSNGWSVDDKDVVRRKTLQLNFRRLGDQYYQDAREIRFVSPAEWVYRASTLKVPEAPKQGAAKSADQGAVLVIPAHHVSEPGRP
jgi:hypothetical protein